MFNKSRDLFPSADEQIYLAHCGVSPLYSKAAARASELLNEQMRFGGIHFMSFYGVTLDNFKAEAARLLHTQPENLAAVRNTSEALSMIANGYPFEAGDEIITFTHEYPSNFYPWAIQEEKGVLLRQIPNRPLESIHRPDLVGSFSVEDVARLITPRTRIVALSHVQFTSGFAADLKSIGALCKAHGIDFIVDAAQSLGSMPLHPETWNISAIASAGWKWLLGPMGSGVFYTAPAFRDKLRPVLIGAESMTQGFDYLDHRWTPHHSARRFEYSTSSITHVAALEVAMREVNNHYGTAVLFDELLRLQDVFLQKLSNPGVKPVVFEAPHRSGILSLVLPDAAAASKELASKGVYTTARGGFLRIAPHFYNTDEDMESAANALNALEI